MADQEQLLNHIRERYDYLVAAWADIREAGRLDMRNIADGPWTDEEIKERKAASRPCLTLDELSQYTNQSINDIRQNKRAVKVIPRGSGANDQTAEYHAGIIRQIEYASNAQAAYIGAFQSMIERSYGFFKITTAYVGKRTKNQKLRIVAIRNPDTVLVDQDGKEPDYSDMEDAFVVDSFTHKAFRKRWPKAKIQNFSSDLIEEAPAWVGDEKIQVAEYWRMEDDPEAEAPPAADDDEEDCPCDRIAVQYITNGIEILERNPTKFDEIPIITVFGPETFVDTGAGSKRRLASMVRKALHAYKLYCYYRSCQAELVGMTPKTPYIGYEGQFNTKTPWDRINKENLGFAEVKAQTAATGANILPLPHRETFEPALQALELGAEGARRAIQSAMGISGMLSGHPGQSQEAKSGIALKELDSQTAQGNYHFVDTYDRALERSGRLLQRSIKWCYDTECDVPIRKPDDTHGLLHINGPSQDEQGQPMRFNTADGDHDVTISVGPSQQSQRDAADDFVDGLMRMPNLPPKAMALGIKLKNLGPIGDELAKVFDPEEQDGMDPAAAAQQMQALQQKLATTEAFAQSLHEQIQTHAADLESREKIAAMQEETKRVLGLAQLDSKEAQTKLEAELNVVHQRVDKIHERLLQAADHAHQQATQQTALDASQQSQQADQAHQSQMAIQSQQAEAQQPAS